jgi:hypothetical protein
MIEDRPLTGPLPLFSIKKIQFYSKKKNKTIKKYTLVNKIVFFIEKRGRGVG